MSYNNMGFAYYNLSESRRAIGYYEEALAIRLKLYPDGVHPHIVNSYLNLSLAWQQVGDVGRKEEYAKKADEVKTKLKR